MSRAVRLSRQGGPQPRRSLDAASRSARARILPRARRQRPSAAAPAGEASGLQDPGVSARPFFPRRLWPDFSGAGCRRRAGTRQQRLVPGARRVQGPKLRAEAAFLAKTDVVPPSARAASRRRNNHVVKRGAYPRRRSRTRSRSARASPSRRSARRATRPTPGEHHSTATIAEIGSAEWRSCSRSPATGTRSTSKRRRSWQRT